MSFVKKQESWRHVYGLPIGINCVPGMGLQVFVALLATFSSRTVCHVRRYQQNELVCVACCSDSVVIMERWAEVAMGYSHGRVCHAVAGAMKGLIQDWNLMIVQLEHQMLTGHLTLQVRQIACMLALSMVWGK